MKSVLKLSEGYRPFIIRDQYLLLEWETITGFSLADFNYDSGSLENKNKAVDEISKKFGLNKDRVREILYLTGRRMKKISLLRGEKTVGYYI